VSGRGVKVVNLAAFAAAHPQSAGNPTPITVKAQATPTSVAVGPDGALYVGLLRGVPSDPGTAYIYRVVPGQAPVIWARGLTSVTAIAFDRQGSLLATEFNTGGLLSPPTVPGALVRISSNGQTVTTLPVPGLYQPAGLAVSGNGTVYVSNYGDSTTASSQSGEIVKITGL
jgi:sugar lactone lactonase YvrE